MSDLADVFSRVFIETGKIEDGIFAVLGRYRQLRQKPRRAKPVNSATLAIVKAHAESAQLTLDQLYDRRLRRGVVGQTRRAVMADLWARDLSLSEIGAALGGLHHTTVLYGLRKLNARAGQQESLEGSGKAAA